MVEKIDSEINEYLSDYPAIQRDEASINRRLRVNERHWRMRAMPHATFMRTCLKEEKRLALMAAEHPGGLRGLKKHPDHKRNARFLSHKQAAKMAEMTHEEIEELHRLEAAKITEVEHLYMVLPAFRYRGKCYLDTGMPALRLPKLSSEDGDKEAELVVTNESMLGEMFMRKKRRHKGERAKRLPRPCGWVFQFILLGYIGVACWLTLVYTMKFDLEEKAAGDKVALLEMHAMQSNTELQHHNNTVSLELPYAYALEQKLVTEGFANSSNPNATIILEEEVGNSTNATGPGNDQLKEWGLVSGLGIAQTMVVNQPASVFGKAVLKTATRAIMIRAAAARP